MVVLVKGCLLDTEVVRVLLIGRTTYGKQYLVYSNRKNTAKVLKFEIYMVNIVDTRKYVVKVLKPTINNVIT